MDSESDECNRGPGHSFFFFFFIPATLRSVGCSEGSCCVSEITLAFNLTKSLHLKRGSSNWQAAPTDVGASQSVCCVFNREGSTACSICICVCVCMSDWLGRVDCACGWCRFHVCFWVHVAAWWHLLYMLPAYPWRFVWQLYDLCVCVCWMAITALSGTAYSTEYTNHSRIERERIWFGQFFLCSPFNDAV